MSSVGCCTHVKKFQFVYLCEFTDSGSYYLCIADNKHLSISRTSVCRCIQRVTNVITSKKNDFIKFPNTAKAQEQIHEDFMVYCGIPTVIGAINGTQIRIQKPVSHGWYQYLNCKSVTSINIGVSKF